MTQQPCPFCPIMGIEENEYRNVEHDSFGEPSTVNGIASCWPCAQVITTSNCEAEYIADLAGRLDLPLMDDVDQMAKAIQEKLQEANHATTV